MADLVHNYGLELPVYESVVSIAQMHGEVPDYVLPSPTFVRPIIVTRSLNETIVTRGLKKVLDIADGEFNALAEQCRAEPIAHTWGLIGRPRPISEYIPPLCDLALVAEVDTVCPKESDDKDVRQRYFEISDGIISYQNQKKDFRYTDLKVNQFMFGSTQHGTANWLIDIDLYLSPE